jgi:hypothetical protein
MSIGIVIKKCHHFLKEGGGGKGQNFSQRRDRTVLEMFEKKKDIGL